MSDCTRHPGVKAAWSCASCATLLCEACGADDFRTKRRVARCGVCGALVEEVRVYVEILPPFAMVRPFLRSLATLEGMSFLGVLIGVVLLSAVPFVGGFLATAMTVAWYLVVVTAASEGGSHPPAASLEGVGGLAGAVGRLLLGCVWVIALVVLAMMAHRTSLAPLYGGVAFCAALALMPAILARTTLTSGVLQLLDPRAPIYLVALAPAAYLRVLVLWLVTLLGGLVPAMVLRGWAAQGGGWGVSLVAQLVELLGLTLSAFSVGWWVYEHAETFGLRDPAERWITQVPNPIGRAPLPSQPQAGAVPLDADGLPSGHAPPVLSSAQVAEGAAPLPVDDSVITYGAAGSGGWSGHTVADGDDALPVDASVLAFAQGAQRLVQTPGAGELSELPVDHNNLGGSRVQGDARPPARQDSSGVVNATGSSTDWGAAFEGALVEREVRSLADAWAQLARQGTANTVPGARRLAAAQLLAQGGRAGRAADVLKSVVTDVDKELAAQAGEYLVGLLLVEGRPKEALAVLDALQRSGRASAALLARRGELTAGLAAPRA